MTTVGVVGGGRMGAGIAHVFAVAGHDVVVVESDIAGAEAARGRLHDGLARAETLGVLTDTATSIEARTDVVVGVEGLPGDAGLVVEAVFEDAAVKGAVLTAVEAAVGAGCVIATNTSSLSVGELSAMLEEPSRFIGMHFFNPVPASKLVEVVTAAATSPGTVEQAVAWVRELAKQEIVVRDSPGFATSRLGVLLGLEAIRMLDEGVADAESIDRAMELGYRHPMGPLRSTDLVGLDVRLAIADHLSERLGDRFDAPQLLRDKVAAGELGRKSGRGFYDWG